MADKAIMVEDSIHIIIVTEDKNIIEQFYKALSSFSGSHLILKTINSYKELIQNAAGNKFDIVYYDYNVSHGDRAEALKNALKLLSGKPLVVIIDDSKSNQIEEVLNIGATDYIVRNELSTVVIHHSISRNLLSGEIAADYIYERDTFKKLAEISPDAVTITDLEGRIIYLSKRAMQMYGIYNTCDVLNKSIFDFLIPDEFDIAKLDFNNLLEKGYVQGKEYSVLHKDGSILLVQTNGALLKDDQTKPKAVILTTRDITDQRYLERELSSYKDSLELQVKERGAELSRKSEELKRSISMRRQAEYLTGIIYDLANALCVATNINDSLRLCLDASILVSKMDCGGIYLFDEKTGALDLAFHRGLSPEFIKEVSHYEADSDHIKLVLGGKPIYTQYDKTGVNLSEVNVKEGLKGIGIIPLIHRGKVVGVMNVASRTRGSIPENSRQALETIANQIGGTVARLRAEKRLRESETRLRAQYDSSPAATYVWERKDDDFVLMDYNDTAARAALGKLDDCKFIKANELCKDCPEAIEAFQRCWEEKKTIEKEIWFRLKTEKKEKIFSINMAWIPPNQILVQTMDITEKKKAEELLRDYNIKLEAQVKERTEELRRAYGELELEINRRKYAEEELRQNEERFRSLIETTGDLVAEIDINGIFTYISPSVSAVLGYSAEEMINLKHLGEIMGEGGVKDINSKLERFKKTPGVFKSTEMNFISKDGRELVFEIGALPVFTKDGTLCGIRAIGREITQKKIAAQELAQAHKSLEKKAAELEELNKEFTHYSYVVSHDLKEPLRTIYNSAEYLRKDLAEILSSSQEKYFDYLSEAVKRCVNYADALLTLSRIGRIQKPFEKIDTGVFLRGLLTAFNLSRDVDVTIADDLPVIEAEPILLHQIFQNVISNAIKFNDSERKKIEIGWSPEGHDFIKLYIRDNGRGIETKEFERIFQVFEKIHTQENDDGMGMGLAIVRKAVSQLNGQIYLESELNKGSVFYIVLPRKQASH